MLFLITYFQPFTTKHVAINPLEHILCKQAGAIEKTTLDWNPQGYRRRGRLKRTWQRTTEDEIRVTG
jgi:hypothetical protein